jgi:hypothetical protein
LNRGRELSAKLDRKYKGKIGNQVGKFARMSNSQVASSVILRPKSENVWEPDREKSIDLFKGDLYQPSVNCHSYAELGVVFNGVLPPRIRRQSQAIVLPKKFE